MDIIIYIGRQYSELIEELKKIPDGEADEFEGAGFHGGGDLITILVTVTKVTLPALLTALRNHWAKGNHVTIEIDGVKVTGTPAHIEAVLHEHIAAQPKPKEVQEVEQ